MQNGTLKVIYRLVFANDDHSGDPWRQCIIKVIGTKGSTRYVTRDWVINDRKSPLQTLPAATLKSIKIQATHFINNVSEYNEAPLFNVL